MRSMRAGPLFLRIEVLLLLAGAGAGACGGAETIWGDAGDDSASTGAASGNSSASSGSAMSSSSSSGTAAGACPNALYAQCGGMTYSGPTCCPTGATCQVSSAYYSQCTP